MKKIKQILRLLPLVIIFFANIGWGQLIFTEDFSYTAGTLLSANGWTAYSGAGTNAIPVTNGGLTYAGFVGSGIGNAASLLTNGEDDNRTFTSQASGSVYASFMVNVSASQTTGDYFLHFIQSPSTSNVFVGKVFAKKDPTLTTFAFGVAKRNNSATATYTGYNYSVNTTYLIVVKYTFNSGSTTDDICYLFVNPVINGSEPAPDLISAVETTTDATNIDMIAVRQGTTAAASTLWVDGIRVGTTWNNVVPVVVPTPTIIVNPSSLPAFQTSVGVPSASKTYTVSATNLTTDLVITAPANFEIRENGIGIFGSSLSYTPVSGTVTQKIIEVRCNSGTAGTYSDIITNVSLPATQNVAVTGAVNTLYFNKSGLNLDDVTNWGTDPNGNGIHPPNFSSANQTFMIVNGTNSPMNAAWPVSGGYSKVVLGDSVNPIGLNINSNYALTGTIDVSANATLKLQNSTLPTLGTLNANSTVSFEQFVPTVIPAGTYGNLKAVGTTKTFASGITTVLGNLTANAVSNFDGSGSPFSTVNLTGDFSLLNGTYFTTTPSNRLTLICNGSSPQTLMGNGSDFKLFRITVQNPSGVTLASNSNLILGNITGVGGYSLLSGDLTVGDNTLSLVQKATITGGGTGSLICAVTSNLYFSNDGTNDLGTLKLKSGFETVNNFTIDIGVVGTWNYLFLGTILNVNGTLNLTSGVIYLGTNNLTLGSSAVLTGSSFIVTDGTGEFIRYISNNDTYALFPVGNFRGYTPVSIKLNLASTPDVFGVKVTHIITNPPFIPFRVINAEWNITEGTPGGSNATIKFTFNRENFGYLFDESDYGFEIGHYNAGYQVFSGSISWPPEGSPYTITSTQLISSFSPFIVGNHGSVTGAIAHYLGLTAMLSGNCNGSTMVPKSVTVELHNATTPYTLVESKTVTLNTSGVGNPVFTTAVNGTPYYIVLKFDNGIETWSATPQTFSAYSLTYDFTDSATKAFGSNMQFVGSKWCIISGDANQDGSVDALDRSACWNDRNLSGVYVTDLNGDGVVDALDRSIAWNNRNLSLQKPALLANPNRKGIKQDNKVDNDNSKGKTFDLKLDGSKVKKVKD